MFYMCTYKQYLKKKKEKDILITMILLNIKL